MRAAETMSTTRRQALGTSNGRVVNTGLSDRRGLDWAPAEPGPSESKEGVTTFREGRKPLWHVR